MRFLRKINRGAIVLVAVLLCVVLGAAFVAMSRNKRLAEAEDAVCSFMEEAVRLYKEFESSYGGNGGIQPRSKEIIGDITGDFTDSMGGEKNEIEGYEEFEAFAKDKLSVYFADGKLSSDTLRYLYEGGYLKYWDYNMYTEAEEDSVDFYEDGGVSFTYQVAQKGLTVITEDIRGITAPLLSLRRKRRTGTSLLKQAAPTAAVCRNIISDGGA